MKTFIADIIPRIQKFSQKLDNKTLLTNQHWVVIDEINSTKTVYIFRSNNELLISISGKVEKAKWEYLDKNSLLIDMKAGSYLFRHGFFDENILALKIDGKDEYVFLVNETKFDAELNSYKQIIEFLNYKYIKTTEVQPISTLKKKKDKKITVSARPKAEVAPVFIQHISTGERRYIAQFEWDEIKKGGKDILYRLIQ